MLLCSKVYGSHKEDAMLAITCGNGKHCTSSVQAHRVRVRVRSHTHTHTQQMSCRTGAGAAATHMHPKRTVELDDLGPANQRHIHDHWHPALLQWSIQVVAVLAHNVHSHACIVQKRVQVAWLVDQAMDADTEQNCTATETPHTPLLFFRTCTAFRVKLGQTFAVLHLCTGDPFCFLCSILSAALSSETNF